jgi:Xaa-Pro dipeptidase
MEDLHMLAAKIILKGLIDLKLINGEVDELMDNNIFALFFPTRCRTLSWVGYS